MIEGMYGLPVTKEAIIYPAPYAQQKLLKELYTGEYTVEKTAEEIDQAWDREAQEE